ncbi:Zonadhesin, partial [Ophiophagus hannah]
MQALVGLFCLSLLLATGKTSSFTIVKSCYQASKCLRSSKRNSFMKVNVNIECSSSPAGKMESEGGKAPVHWSNELPNNQLLPEVFNRPKSRAAVVFNPNPNDIKFKAVEDVKSTDLPVKLTNPTVKPTDPPVKPTDTPVKPTDPPVKPTDP